MKNLLTIVLLCTLFNFANSQTISPVETGEFCPNTEYTFIATITKQYSSMIGLSGCVIT